MSLKSKIAHGAATLVRVVLVLISLLLIVGLLSEYFNGELSHTWFFWTCQSWTACFIVSLPTLIFVAPVFVEGGLLIIRLKKRMPPPFSPDD